MKFAKINKDIKLEVEIIDIKPDFSKFGEILECDLIELYKMGKFIIILDEEGLLKTEKNDNLSLFAGDILIGIDGVYDWKYTPLEKSSENGFLELSEGNIKEINEAVNVIKYILEHKNFRALKASVSLEEIYNKYSEQIKVEEKTSKNMLIELLKAMTEYKINFTLTERFVLEYIYKNFFKNKGK